MKRVLSIRISYETVAQCYDLVETGANPRAMNMSSVLVMALEAMLEGLYRAGKVRLYTPEEAEQRISEFMPKQEWPGIDMTGVTTPERQDNTPLRDQETALLTEKEGQHMPARQDIDITRPLPPGEYSVTVKGIDNQGNIEYETDSGRTVVERRAEIMRTVEQELAAIEQAENADLESVASIGEVYRTSPEAPPPPKATKAPWEGATLAREKDIKEDKLYQAALTVDEQMVLALRVVYAVLPKEQWGSEKAIELIQSTYKTFKEYKEEGK